MGMVKSYRLNLIPKKRQKTIALKLRISKLKG